MVGSSHATIGRLERGEARFLTVEMMTIVATVLGLDLRVGLYPIGSALRDAGHLALLERLRVRLGSMVRWRTEVPVPIPGDLRAADACIDSADLDAMVEAETRLSDTQALLRRIDTKQRDMGVRRVILLVADTRHNRDVIASTAILRERFPISTRACLAALSVGRDPGGDALVIL